MVSSDNEKSTQENAFVVVPRSGLSFIEQLQISSSKPCTKEKQIHLIGVDNENKKALLTKASCKMWSCETCGSRMAKKWIARIINGVNALGGEWSFLTLTAHRSFRKEKSVGNLRSGWKKLYNRILESVGKSGKELHYCKVWEQHTEGSFHLHILINCNLGTRWAKDSAAQCGMGYQAEWHTVDNAGIVAGYIAKYTLKNATMERNDIKIPKGLRRIETDRKWPKLPKLDTFSDFEWNIADNRDFQLYMADKLEKTGFVVIDTVKK